MTSAAVREHDQPRSPWTLLAAATAIVLPLAFSTTSTAPSWLPKTAFLLAMAPIGLALAVANWRNLASKFGLGFVFVAAVAAGLSSSPVLSFVGPYAAGTSVLLFAGMIGLFAVGQHAAADARSGPVANCLLGAITGNAFLALLQTAVDLTPFGLGAVESRSAALMGNPVHLATLLAGGFPLVWWKTKRATQPLPFLALATLLAASAQVSGSRFLLLGLAASSVLLLLLQRTWRAGLFVVCLLVGALAGSAIGSNPEFVGASSRISSVGVAEGSTLQRIYTWQEAVPTVIERPVFGFGPGRYLQATVRHRGEALAKAGPDSYFADAHNLFVDVAVGTGLIGLALLCAWMLLALRAASGPFAWVALSLLAMHTVQPVHPGTTPLIGLALGLASVSRAERSSARGRFGRSFLAAGGVAGAVAGVLLLIGDVRLQSADLDGDRRSAAAAAGMLPPWPEVSDAVARLTIFDAVVARDERLFDEAAGWELRGARVDETDPRWWMLTGLVQARAGQTEAATASFERALGLNPYSCGAWNGLIGLNAEGSQARDGRHGQFCGGPG